MYLVHVQFKKEKLTGTMVYQNTILDAIEKAEQIVKEQGQAKNIDIFEDQKHIISLRTIR